jgi:plastocyanin
VPAGAVELNQSAAQPCYLSAGETAPGAAPCPEVTQPEFDGTQPLYNSGILKDDQVFKVTLSDKLEPGTYQYFCLFHGPEMRGTINVVAPGAKAPSAAAVEAAGNKQLNATVKKIQPALAKADAKAKPGTVQSGVGVDGVNAEAVEFAPTDVSIPVGGSVTWNLSFHTVSFNFPESARPDIIQDAVARDQALDHFGPLFAFISRSELVTPASTSIFLANSHSKSASRFR